MAPRLLRNSAFALIATAALLLLLTHGVSTEAVVATDLEKPFSPVSDLDITTNLYAILNSSTKALITTHHLYPRDPPAEASPDDPLASVTGRADLWTKHQRRGFDFYCAFYKPSKLVPQSRWNNIADLTRYGWQKAEDTTNAAELSYNFRTMCGKLGCSTGNARRVDWEHEGTWVGDNGVKNNPTGGDYVNIFSPSGVNGMIVACWNRSPKSKSAETSGLVVPPLSRWSDVAYLQWADQTNWFNVRRLKYVVRSSVINKETKWTLREAFERRKMVYGGFADAKEISIESEEVSRFDKVPAKIF